MQTTNDRPGSKAADHPIHLHGEPAADPAVGAVEERQRAEALQGIHHGMTLPDEEDVRVGAPGCQHCEVVPATIEGPGTLRLRFPHTFTLGKVLDFLVDSPWPHREEEGTVAIDAPPGSLAPVVSPILDLLTPVEAGRSQARFEPAGQVPQANNAFEIDALPRFVAKARSGWLLNILRGQRLRTVFQPILRCPPAAGGADGYEVHGHECLMRAEVGAEMVPAGPMIEMARRADLIFQLDLAARRSAILGAAEHGLPHKVFVNFTPNSIFDPWSCLDSTVRLIDEVGLAREQVVFEVVEGERLPGTRHLQRIVAFYREHGFGVALDDLGAGFSSPTALLAIRPDYAKLDMDLIRDVHRDAAKALVARKLVEAARELGMRTIAEGIEAPAELAWCAEHGVDFVQGYLFARPAAPPSL